MLTFTDRFVPRAKPGASSSHLRCFPHQKGRRVGSAQRLSRSSRCLSCSCAQSRDCSLGARAAEAAERQQSKQLCEQRAPGKGLRGEEPAARCPPRP